MSFRGTVNRLRKDETGFALVLALAIVLALGTSVASVAYVTTANFHSAKRS